MKVLQVIDNFGYGGAELLVATLSGVAGQAGLDMSVACLGPRTPERSVTLPLLTEAGLRPRFIGVRRMIEPTGVERVRRTIVASGCDVVHAHCGYSALLVPLAARLAGVPCVSTLHHVPSPHRPRRELIKERLWTRSAERGAALVFVSEAARKAAVELVGPARPTWRVLYNGVDLARFRPAPGATPRPLPADLPIEPGLPVVTVVAALRAPKGHEIAIRAWPQVRTQVPDAVLLIVGSGAQEHVLRTIAGPGVVFAGVRSDVPEILAGSTLALLPSFTEALPTTMIEAAASGLATVATTVGGTAETVEHERTGLLVPPRDGAALGSAVVRLLKSRRDRAEFGAAGRNLAVRRFDIHTWAANLADLYQQAASRELPATTAVTRRGST